MLAVPTLSLQCLSPSPPNIRVHVSGNWMDLAGLRGPWGVGRSNPHYPEHQSPLIHYHGRGQKRASASTPQREAGPARTPGRKGPAWRARCPSCPLPERPSGPTSASRFTSPRLAADLGASEGGRRSHPERSEGPNPARRPPGGVKRTPKRPRAPNVTGIRPIRAQALPPCLVRAEMGRKASRAGEKSKNKGRELRRMTIIVRSLDRALS